MTLKPFCKIIAFDLAYETPFIFLTDDKSAPKDFKDFCTNTGHELVNVIKEKDYNKIEIKRINFEK